MRPKRAKRAKGPRRSIRISGKKVAIALVILVVAAVGCAAGAFAWDRWLRYDDAWDIQGEWQLSGTQRVMVVTDSQLKITADVSYDYTIDEKAKTITYSFGDKSGTAHYRFSDDRNTLVIDENGGTDWLVALHLKSDEVMDSTNVAEGISKLTRISHDASAQPRSLGESDDGEGEVNDVFYIEGYTEYTDTSGKKKQSSSNGSSSSKSESDDDAEKGEGEEKDESAASGDPDAAYTDPETGISYYYDSTLVLYYDTYGNYFYDMYGQNPYVPPTDSYDDAANNDGATAY